MIVLGIDPGTRCGWAVLQGHQRMCSGVWDLKPRRHEGGGMRFLRFRGYLREILGTLDIEAVGYEEVRRHMGVDAAHIYGGIVAALTAELEERQIPYQGLPVGTVKKIATGKGNASKDAMVQAAIDRWGHFSPETDDEADALFVALTLAMQVAS